MKQITRWLLVIAALPVAIAQAQQPAPWPQVLVSEPYHVGDDTVQEMRHPKPHAPRYTGTFTLPATVKLGEGPTVVVELTVAGIAPMTGRTRLRAEEKGTALAKLLINGQEVVVLNTVVRGEHSNALEQTVKVPVAGKFLRAGSNELVIEPGGSKGKEGLDDCEVLRLAVGSPAG